MRPHFTRFSAWFIHLTVLFVSASQILAQQGSRYAGYGVQQANNGQAFPWTSNFVQRAKPSKREAAHHECSRLEDDSELAMARPSISLTVSPLASTKLSGIKLQRQVKLRWNLGHSQFQDDDWVGIFLYDVWGKNLTTGDANGTNDDPANQSQTLSVPVSNPLAKVMVDGPMGEFLTALQVPVFDDHNYTTELVNSGDNRLFYWAGYIRNGTVVASDGFSFKPHWMKNNWAALGNVPLRKLMIPGTHNSGSYEFYKGWGSENVVARYTYNQDEDVFHQLMFGNRYLDLRIGHYENDLKEEEMFWVNHDYVRIMPLLPILQQIKRFLELTGEVVILDIHRFPVGFDTDAPQKHAKLVRLIRSELGNFTAPWFLGNDVTMNQLWSLGRPLIITYAELPIVQQNPDMLWEIMPQEWGDKRTPNDLKTFIESAIRRRIISNYFWAAMTELTPSSFDVFLKPFGGIRKLANKISNDLERWLTELWWDSVNIVATDYFHSNNVIDIALRANIKRAKCFHKVTREIEEFYKTI